ncbi:MAG: low affinity iron permease family protein, partial [Phycisphaerae bacterium]
FTDTWQLVINTGTTIVTFLMVFLIQNTQNRDAKAIHLKLDELLRAVKGARTRLVNLEEMSDREMAELHEEFERVKVRAEARSHAAHGRAERADHKAENAEQAARSAHGKAEEASEAAREAKEVAERARDARG